MMSAAVATTAKLPQMNESAEYGKSKEQFGNLEKTLTAAIEKTMEATSQMVLKAATEIAKAQKEQFVQISRRIESLEKAGGVSQSAPRGTVDGEVQKTRTSKGPVWGGIFGGAASKATSKM